MTEPLYEDRWITCEPEQLVIRGPGKRKVIPYREIREVELQPLALANSMWRPGIRGSSLNALYWDSYFTDRPRPQAVLRLQIGRWHKQIVITDHPMTVAGIIENHRNPEVPDQ